MEDLSHLPWPLLLLVEVVNHPLLFPQHLFGFKGATDGFCFLQSGTFLFSYMFVFTFLMHVAVLFLLILCVFRSEFLLDLEIISL